MTKLSTFAPPLAVTNLHDPLTRAHARENRPDIDQRHSGGGAYGPPHADMLTMAPVGRAFSTWPDVVRGVTGEQIDMDGRGGRGPMAASPERPLSWSTPSRTPLRSQSRGRRASTWWVRPGNGGAEHGDRPRAAGCFSGRHKGMRAARCRNHCDGC
jgi:hypothetical protein